MTVSVRVDGLRDLDKALEQLSKAAGRGALRRALKKAAEPLVEEAKKLAPVDDGGLRDSIAISTRLDKRQASLHRRMFRDDRASIEMFVGPSYNLGAGGRHGHLQEFGTTHHGPQPFMRPAWAKDQGPMLERLKRDLWDEIQKSIARAERKAARQRGRL